MRFTQSFQGMEVEGAALMVHTDDEGNVIGVNGEHVDTSKLPLTPSIGAARAIQAALAESVSSAIVGRASFLCCSCTWSSEMYHT